MFEKSSKLSLLSFYAILVAFRIINGFLNQTFGHPDEFWQSAEVAHNQVFGYGYLTWEWTNKDPIRSPVFPGVFSALYLALKSFGLDNPWLVAYGPRIFHAFISGLFDLVSAKFAVYTTNIKDPYFWVLINYTTWYSLYNIPRTLINVSEATLFIIAFFLWKLAFTQNDLKLEILSRLFISLNFCMRPTSIAIWAPIWLIQGFHKFDFRRFVGFCFKCGLNCIFMVGLSILIDTLYFGKFTWAAFNFVKFNAIEDKSAQYGVYNPLWYFIAAMPLITLGWFPPFITGAIEYIKTSLGDKEIPELAIYIAFESLFLSINPHKEDRFLMKLMPFMFIFIGLGVFKMYQSLSEKKIWKPLLLFFIGLNLAYFGYSSLIDKRGAIDVMDHLRGHNNEIDSVVFFTECHRTPYYSHIHKNITMRFPGCSPYEESEINDSTSLFLDSDYFIERWLNEYKPTHVVLYNQFLRDGNAGQILEDLNYKEEKRFFNSLFVDTPTGYSIWHELVVFRKVVPSSKK